MNSTTAFITQSLNLKQFNLTPDEEADVIWVFQDRGREKALQYASNLQEQKLYYNNVIDTYHNEPNKHQKTRYATISSKYNIVRVFMDTEKYLIFHVKCPQTNYYKIIGVSRRGFAIIRGAYKHYDFTKKEPYLKVLV